LGGFFSLKTDMRTAVLIGGLYPLAAAGSGISLQGLASYTQGVIIAIGVAFYSAL